MMKQLNNLFAAALIAGMLAGCGTGGASVPTAPKSSIDRVRFQNAPVGQPGAGGAGITPNGPGAQEGAQILDGMRRQLASARGFEAEVRSYSEGHFKSGEKVSELRKSTTQAKLIWMKPAKLRGEVITSTNPLMQGAAMATTDGENITARAKGLLGLFPIKMKASDKNMSNNRGVSFTQQNPDAQLSRLTSPTAKWTVIGVGQVGSTPVKLIQVDNVNRLDREITREVIMVDTQAMGLRGLAMYAAEKKVTDLQFLKFKWNPSVSSSTFSL